MVSQAIVNEFCRSGALERSIETVKAALRERVQTLAQALATRIAGCALRAAPGWLLHVGRASAWDGRQRAVHGRGRARRPVRQGLRFRARRSRLEPQARLFRSDAARRSRKACGASARPIARSRRAPAGMRPEEVTAFGELAGDAVAGLTAQVRDLHHGIAGRAFKGSARQQRRRRCCTTRSPTTHTARRG